MGATKEMFLQMREQDIIQMYDGTFTKKEATKVGLKLAEDIIENGNVSKHEALANLVRLNEVITNAITKLKDSVSNDKVSILGVEFTPVNGRQIPQYNEDEVYNSLHKQLKDREELLKTAIKTNTEFYDNEGVLVPKVSVNNSKSSLTIKF